MARCRCCWRRNPPRAPRPRKLALDLSLARVYQEKDQWAKLEEVAARLLKAWPNSGLAFHYQQWARINQKRWD